MGEKQKNYLLKQYAQKAFTPVFLSLIMFISAYTISKSTTYILIHGTWSRSSSWYQEEGDFYDALYSAMSEHDEIISFSWSGILSEKERNKAANLLVSLLETFEESDIVLVGHSHGGNVALSAIRLLQQKMPEKRIHSVILLGTPQYHHATVPENVWFVFNIFSFGDMIQPVFNVFRREIAESPRTANIALVLEGREPDHHCLYHPLVGFYLPEMIHISVDQKKKMATCPYKVSVSWQEGLQFIADIDRKEKMKRDLLMQERLLTNILWGPTEAVYFYP